ncbi:MAG TPA: ATP-dependent zinc metalloprotease FtsH [Acidimicrobiales bacterium]|nr:ATP-dependent zinc metalloprotease FtsH [Acidimicrobiales bacterium]
MRHDRPDAGHEDPASGAATPPGDQRSDASPVPPDPERWNIAGGPDGAPATPPPMSRRTRIVLAVLWGLLVAGFVVLLVVPQSTKSTPASIPYSTFLTRVEAGQVRSIDVNQATGVIDGTSTDAKQFTTQGPPGGMPAGDVATLDAHKVARNYVSTAGSIWPTVITWLLLGGGFVLVWILLARRGRAQAAGLSNWSRTQARLHSSEQPSTTFADIAGYEAVKEEIGEIVRFLRDPSRFTSVGARIPKGVLLVGPPGTGKTLFARAVAGEAGVPFLSISGSEFMEMFVGVGAARVRDLFGKAREQKPSIIFVDEIDAIGRKRGTGLGGGHDEREQTLNQLLSEMDGFEEAEGIVVLAATNRPDVLDPALLRAGRFDRQVVIPLPTLPEREAILQVHCRSKQLEPDVDLAGLARGTPGMSGADLENLVNEAALIAVRRDAAAVTQADVDAARDRVLLGLRRSSLVLSDEEKRIVAFHESGHALLAHLLPHADPVHKVTILPTGMALGATQQLPVEDRQLQQRPYLQDALAVRLGGRAAEEVVFGVPSTGAQDDLSSATELAGRMVREWGMSDALGAMAWGPRGPVFLGEELLHTREYSDETARVIDEEVAAILATEAERARHLLTEHRPALDALADALLLHESLDAAQVRSVVDGAQARSAARLRRATG